MGRVERRKQEKIEKKRRHRNNIWILLLLCLLISGILVVDHTLRDRMMIEEPGVLGYGKINKDLYTIYICGQKLYVDRKQIIATCNGIKNEINDWIKILKEEKDQLLYHNRQSF